MNEKLLIRILPFTMDLVFTVYYLAAPLLLIELKANPVELGLVGTLTSSVQMGMAHVMGRLSDRLGRRRLLVAGPLLFLISCIVMILAREVWIILALSLLNGLCVSMFWPSFQAWIADRQSGSSSHGTSEVLTCHGPPPPWWVPFFRDSSTVSIPGSPSSFPGAGSHHFFSHLDFRAEHRSST